MLRDQMPSIYSDIQTMLAVFAVEDTEIQTLKDAVSSALDQFFVSTSTDTIERWEKEAGLSMVDIPIEQRRSNIISKFRGYGTVTVSHIKNLCQSFTNGDVVITEKPSTYEFDIKFVSVRGTPPNLNDLKNVIEQIKPAHLGVTYTYLYTSWDRFDSFNYTWDQIDALNKTWDQIEVI
ncbi:YmfQ family protein [Robertmurraya korlensis]|uniref:putative phage tail protein n=1 Tax=Robertmurraya korlensis TaxID=519977 RepID=UPI00203C3C5C|nr:putative phage tail protein [Robertmurraya korlensis]MCM3599401.1 YmfQ family protein [Robertmurraya korlensis]